MKPLDNESRHHKRPCLERVVGLGALAILIAFCFQSIASQAAEPTARAAQKDDELLKEAQSAFRALPKDMATPDFPVTPERVSLGRKLFFETRVSVDGTMSCARCHLPSLYGIDGLATSHGIHDKIVSRNAPTVLNAAVNVKQHWGGELESVEDQAKKALLPAFGNPNYAAAMAKLRAIPGYREMFKKCFPGDADPVTEDNWAKAIGAYERTLVTPSRFDDYLGGKTDALTAAERQGLRVFIDTGCARCHDGAGIGGKKFRKFGVREDYWKATGSKQKDKGRSAVSQDPSDDYVFKVPLLRNVEMTAPYFHDGSVATLPAAVRVMARVQLGKTLSEEDTTTITTFLKCLTGKVPDDFAKVPVLPPAAFPDVPPTGERKPK